MPLAMSKDKSVRRRIGIVGAHTRQRVALIGHPLSLHYISEGPTGLAGSLPLPRARYKLADATPAPPLNGTV